MIYFFADDHYGTHPGRVIFEHLAPELRARICFTENQWDVLNAGDWSDSCELLILHMIGGSCDQPYPGPLAVAALERYCRRGGNVLLLHGSSAAFWKEEFFRKLVGFRWVRAGDPDGVASSTHPAGPCEVKVAKVRHELKGKLRDVSLPEDEIYTELEQTSPSMILMTADVNGHTSVQCCETVTAAGGKVLSFIPGHKVECTSNPDLIYDIVLLIDYLCKENH
ncbi:MAG: ThuA domain-containing protein [Victivallaceae bacterium]|nr:ThuA domain-containing protein [Victivallaceae bacterium]